MTQRQQWRASGGEQAWLALLVETFEHVSRDPAKSADPVSIAALKSQLARPAAAIMSSAIALH